MVQNEMKIVLKGLEEICSSLFQYNVWTSKKRNSSFRMNDITAGDSNAVPSSQMNGKSIATNVSIKKQFVQMT
jgi:hypothetical protein